MMHKAKECFFHYTKTYYGQEIFCQKFLPLLFNINEVYFLVQFFYLCFQWNEVNMMNKIDRLVNNKGPRANWYAENIPDET